MPVRPCLGGCGALIKRGSYCRRCDPAPRRYRQKRGSGWAASRWRAKVLAQTGGRCAVPGCRTPYDRVQAHHVVALADGGQADGVGVPLCLTHHVKATEDESSARR
jgi:hypothetical protein